MKDQLLSVVEMTHIYMHTCSLNIVCSAQRTLPLKGEVCIVFHQQLPVLSQGVSIDQHQHPPPPWFMSGRSHPLGIQRSPAPCLKLMTCHNNFGRTCTKIRLSFSNNHIIISTNQTTK